MSRKFITSQLRLALVAGASMIATGAWAQTARTASAAVEVEEITVVGSNIKGAKVDAALPVTVVGADQVMATGAVSGDELFRSIPQAGDVQFQEARTTGNLNDARGDVSSLNLRNLGTGNTLMLLNGRRAVMHPGTQTENLVPVQTPNTNAIPVSGVKRLEVLRDGAAAIYGADAVAGVVNSVLDTRFQGLRIEVQGGASEGTGYHEGLLNVKAGTRLDDGTRITFFGSYTGRTRLNASERDYSASEDHRAGVAGTPWDGNTTFDNRSTSSPWGGFNVVGLTTSAAASQVKQGTVNLTASGAFNIGPGTLAGVPCASAVFSSAGAGNLCIRTGAASGATLRPLRYDENPDRTLRGSTERTNLFTTVERDLTDNVEFFGELGYYHALFNGSREQSAPISSAPISMAATSYWNPLGATTLNGVANPNRLANLVNVPVGGLALNITNYRPVDTGPRYYTVTDDSIRALGGLRGEWKGWDWESALVYSMARTKDMTRNTISNTAFQAALSRSTPDAYNPFNGGTQAGDAWSRGDGTPNSRATIESFLVNVYRISETSLALWDLKLSKPDLFSLPAGDVGVAFGVEHRVETYDDDRDKRLDGTVTYTNSVTGLAFGTDVMGASGSPDVSADRGISSVHAELAVPVISPEMSIPFVEELSLQLAARDEYYSDFGNVLKPKIAALWKVGYGLSARGSVSQSFRAPNLPQYYSDGATVANTRTDWAACRINNVTCSGTSTLEVRSGNDELTAEEADNATVGLVYAPTFLPPEVGKLMITADLWQIREKNVIGILGGANQIALDYLLRLGGSSNPNVVRNAPVAPATVGSINFVSDKYTNLQPRLVEGFDIGVDYDLNDTRFGDFRVNVNVAKLLTFDQAPGDAEKALIAAIKAGTIVGPSVTTAGSLIKLDGFPEFRATATITWRKDNWGAGVFISHTGQVYDTGPVQVAGNYYSLADWTTVNLYGQYAWKDGKLDGSTLRIGVRNLQDKDPPLASSNFGYLGALHNSTGRYWYGSLTKSF